MNRVDFPAIIRASAQDKLIFHSDPFHDGQINCIITFSGKPDEQKSARSVELNHISLPVSNYGFTDHFRQPRWERIPDSNTLIPFCLIETKNDRSEISSLPVSKQNKFE